jgi:plastocyanin
MARRRRNALAVLVLVAGLSIGTADGVGAVTVGVRGISPNVWSPKVKRIAPGTIVRWRAVNTRHTVKARGGNWSFFRNLPYGRTAARRFNRRGTFRYFCTVHGHAGPGYCHGMCGSIVVS